MSGSEACRVASGIAGMRVKGGGGMFQRFSDLESMGISLDAARERVEQVTGRGEQVPSGHIPFTPAG